MPDRPVPRFMPFSVRHSFLAPGVSVVVLTGELDLVSAPKLKAALVELHEAGRRHFVIDMSLASFMDSTALGVLIGFRRLVGDDGSLAIAAAGPSILRILEMTGVDRTFERFATVGEAVEHLEQIAGESSHQDDPISSVLRPASHVQQIAPTVESEEASADSPKAALTGDSAVVAGIATTAMPFARCAEDQAEAWLRALRRSGDAAIILSSLGITDEASDGPSMSAGSEGAPPKRDAVSVVTRLSGRTADRRGDPTIRTSDLLGAVLEVYGEDFERVLARHGVDALELAQQLEYEQAAAR